MGQATMRRIGMQLIAEKKAAIIASLQSQVERKFDGAEPMGHSRDLLTLLIKANMELDASNGEHQRMTDEEVLGRALLLLLIGYVTLTTAAEIATFAFILTCIAIVGVTHFYLQVHRRRS